MTEAQLGERVRLARAVRRKSQKEIGRILGLGHSMISRIEAGKGRRTLTVLEANRLADELDLPRGWFFDDNLPVAGLEGSAGKG